MIRGYSQEEWDRMVPRHRQFLARQEATRIAEALAHARAEVERLEAAQREISDLVASLSGAGEDPAARSEPAVSTCGSGAQKLTPRQLEALNKAAELASTQGFAPFAHQLGHANAVTALVRRGLLERLAGSMQYRLTAAGASATAQSAGVQR